MMRSLTAQYTATKLKPKFRFKLRNTNSNRLHPTNVADGLFSNVALNDKVSYFSTRLLTSAIEVVILRAPIS